MPRIRPILIISVILTVAMLAMWGTAGAWTVRHQRPDMRALDGWGAIAVTVLAGTCWLALWRVRYDRDRHDRDRAALIRTLARTVPLRRLDR